MVDIYNELLYLKKFTIIHKIKRNFGYNAKFLDIIGEK